MKDLQDVWLERLHRFKEAHKLQLEADEMIAQGEDVCKRAGKGLASGQKMQFEGFTLHAIASQLRNKGNSDFLSAVIEKHGDIEVDWKNWDDVYTSAECHLSTGEVFDCKAR